MSLEIVFHPDVRAEIDGAYCRYEDEKLGRGLEFLDALQKLLNEIAANPARFGFAERDVREGMLSRFPYAVYYRVVRDRLRVLAVHHTARDPARWQSRS